jgi:hypothetical protein
MSNKICQFFQQGRCKYGDRCRSIHPTGQQYGSTGFGGGGGGFTSNNSFGGKDAEITSKYPWSTVFELPQQGLTFVHND